MHIPLKKFCVVGYRQLKRQGLPTLSECAETSLYFLVYRRYIHIWRIKNKIILFKTRIYEIPPHPLRNGMNNIVFQITAEGGESR
jgi:hypothetical protein